jgi:DGQHR domain-containing protein
VKALRAMIGNKKLYTFLIDVGHLLKFSYIFRVDTNNLLISYQRLLNPKKISKIKKYLSEYSGYFPNNIIAVTNEKINFEEEENSKIVTSGILKLPDKPLYLEIIDGQHRLYGYANITNKKNDCLGVTLIEGLGEKERAHLFVTINREQTPVPPPLLWDLYKIIDPTCDRGKISKFAETLNNDGPFQDLIKLPRIRSSKAYLSSTNLCLTLDKSRTKLYQKYGEKESFTHVIKGFFGAIKEDKDLKEDWYRSTQNKSRKGFLCTNIGISILLRLLEKILTKKGLPEKDNVDKWKTDLKVWIIDPLKIYLKENKTNEEDPYKELRKKNTSEGARRTTADSIFQKSPL